MNIPLPHSRSGMTPSPKSAQRRSLTFDEHEYAYDFPQYTYVPSPASSTSPLPSTTPIPVPPVFMHKPVVKTATAPVSASGRASPARFAHTSGYASLSPNRARGPSFASTTSYASSSTASSSSHSAASSASPATPPRAGYALSTPTRVLPPHWERPHFGDEEEELAERLVEEAEDVPQDVETADVDEDDEYEYEERGYRRNEDYTSYALSAPLASALGRRKPRSVRRSPFADDDPRTPYLHVYLDDDVVPHSYASARASSPGARRLSGSGSVRLRGAGLASDSPRSVARSISLTHSHSQSQRHSSPRRAHSPIAQSPSPVAASLSHCNSHSHTPSLDLGPDASFELDASPLRTALLLNADPDTSLSGYDEQHEAERRFSGRGLGLGLGLGLVGSGSGGGSINLALQRRRAEWTEFEGDEFSSAAAPRGGAHAQTLEDELSSRYDSRSTGQSALGLGLDVDLSSPRPSFSHPYARVIGEKAGECPSGEKQRGAFVYGREDNDEESVVAGAEKRRGGRGEEESEGVPTCLALRWSLRARWAMLKLRVRLGAFRARRRVGLV